jgi:arylformamidase
MRTIDITMPIQEGMASFPGDPPVRIRKERSIGRGDPYELSVLSMGSHVGTHLDPPSHFVPGGASVDQLDLGILNGPCRVIEIPEGVDEVRRVDVGRVPEGEPRILLRTRNSERWKAGGAYFGDYVALGVDAAEALLGKGVGSSESTPSPSRGRARTISPSTGPSWEPAWSCSKVSTSPVPGKGSTT